MTIIISQKKARVEEMLKAARAWRGISQLRRQVPAAVVTRSLANPRRERARAARAERIEAKRRQQLQEEPPVAPPHSPQAPPQVYVPPPQMPSTYTRPPYQPPTFGQTMLMYAGAGVGLTFGMALVGLAFRAIGF